MDPIVIIHGGAWAIPDSLLSSSLLGVQQAAKAAWDSLQTPSGQAILSVEAGVKVLEDLPAFDAGTGSVLTSSGQVELDAMIMDGSDLSCGAVASVRNIRNPVSLAKLVKDKTDHILLVGEGANLFAQENEIPLVPTEELVTPEALLYWEQCKKYRTSVTSFFSERQGFKEPRPQGHDTVGCVALDSKGSLACATSTGGITFKRPGRVGDSPLIGCGGYADNSSAAVSCTGHGESIAKVCLAKGIVDGCVQGMTPADSINSRLTHMASRLGGIGAGGAICIDSKGKYGFAFTTERMAWAVITKDERICGINPGDRIPFE